MPRETRRLAAILAADVAGYSRLMAADETGTLARLRHFRTAIIEPAITQFNGTIVGSAGDSVLVEFASAINAVECASELQNRLAQANAGLPAETRMEFRIGINLGDVIAADDTIYGDGVNVAARLEKLAEPGGICVSGGVYDQIKGKMALSFFDLGERKVHNIPNAVRAYRIDRNRQSEAFADPAATAGPLPLPDKPSIAVLPLANLSGDREQDHFSDGITEDIITALSKLSFILVIARNSTFAYKGKSPDVRQVARDLGVHYVLEGSFRKSADRIRISTQLIDAASGAHVWAERYDRAVSDIFAVQDEITESVVGALEPQLYAAENRRLHMKAPESLDAWGCVIRAMPHVWAWTGQDIEAGLVLLTRAHEIAPDYARATGLLGWTYAARAHLGVGDPGQLLATARDFAQRAIEQDGGDPWAHLAAGYVHMVSRRFARAVEQFSEAIDRNPSFALAHTLMGSTYAYGGDVEMGLSCVAMSTRLSPKDPHQAANLSVIGTCHFRSGRIAEAVDYQRRAVQLRPNFGTAWRSLAAVAGLAGDLELARTALAEARRLQPALSLAWVEAHHPIVDAEKRALYAEGLRVAGLA